MEQDRSRLSVLLQAQGSFLVFHGLRHESACLGPIHRHTKRNPRPPAHGGPEAGPPPTLGVGGDFPEQGSDRSEVRETRATLTDSEVVQDEARTPRPLVPRSLYASSGRGSQGTFQPPLHPLTPSRKGFLRTFRHNVAKHDGEPPTDSLRALCSGLATLEGSHKGSSHPNGGPHMGAGPFHTLRGNDGPLRRGQKRRRSDIRRWRHSRTLQVKCSAWPGLPPRHRGDYGLELQATVPHRPAANSNRGDRASAFRLPRGIQPEPLRARNLRHPVATLPRNMQGRTHTEIFSIEKNATTHGCSTASRGRTNRSPSIGSSRLQQPLVAKAPTT